MGAKKKSFKKRLVKFLALVIAIVVVVTGFKVYTAIQHANMVKFSVEKSVFKPGINLPLIKARDYRFVIVDISIKNNSLQSINIDPLTQVVLTDKKGTRYGPSTLQIDNPLKSGVLAGNATMKGQLSFIVGNNSPSGFKLHLDLKDEDLSLSTDATPSL